MYRALLGGLSDGTGYTPEELHQRFKAEFLYETIENEIFGNTHVV